MKVIHRRILLLITAAVSVLLLSGCWDQRTLDELGFPFLLGYDYAREEEKEYPDDKYLVSVGAPSLYEEAESKYHVERTPGSMVTETRSRRDAHFGEQYILGQEQVAIFGNEIAEKENLNILMDSIRRNDKVKDSLYMAVAEGRAVDLIEMRVKHYPNTGIYIRMLLKNIRKSNFLPVCTLFTFRRDVFSNNTAPMLPCIVQKGEDIVLAGSCFVNDGKKTENIGWMESQTAVFLRGIKARGEISYDVIEDEKVIDRLTFSGGNRRKVKIKKEGDKYIVNIQIILSGVIVEKTKTQPLKELPETLKLSQKSLEDLIKKRSQELVKKVQEEYGFDALNIAKEIKAHSREKFEKEDIDSIIRDAEINVDVKVNIENTGGWV